MLDNFSSVLLHFLSILKVPVSRQSIIEDLERHPDYGSMLAYSEILERYHVTNGAFKMPLDKLNQVPVPFIAFSRNKEFIVVKAFNEDKVIYYEGGLKRKSVSIENFKRIYRGAILAAERQENSGEPAYAVKKRQDIMRLLRLPFIGVCLLVLMPLLFGSPVNFFEGIQIFDVCLLLFKLVGLTASVMLLIQSIDANNPLIQKLCGDEDTNCNAILNSSAAKVWNVISWSEIGFFYFSGTLLMLLAGHRHQSLMHLLAFMNLCCLPYTFYSIYYQWRVAKQWCVFCLSVQAVFWLEFIAFIPRLNMHFVQPSFAEWQIVVSSMIIPIVGWAIMKPLLVAMKKVDPLKEQLRKFKYNASIFEKMINDEVRYSLPSDDDLVVIGNRQAVKTITMIVNPYCLPCGKAYKKLQWLRDRSDVKLQIVYSTPRDNGNKKNVMAAHLLTLQELHGDTVANNALNDWYGITNKDYLKWSKLYPVSSNSNAHERLKKQREWVKLTGSSKTPAFFLNGKKIPQYYESDDFKYLV